MLKNKIFGKNYGYLFKTYKNSPYAYVLSENSINRCKIILTIMHMSSCKTPNSPNIQLLVVKVSLQTN